nr:hypothetical protein [uncultured Acetatifactor sp.]
MKRYYIDLRLCGQPEHDRIKKLIEMLAWDVYSIAGVPKVYEFMWDSEESVLEIPGIPAKLISSYPPQNM